MLRKIARNTNKKIANAKILFDDMEATELIVNSQENFQNK